MNKMITQEDIQNAFGSNKAKFADMTEGLNPKQKLAVETTEGPLCVLAGAGTGKTTVLIRRIANIIKKGLARPEEILAITFTRKAAGEIRERLGHLLGDDVARRICVGNFHAISSEMLRRHAQRINLPQRFNVLDDAGQRDVIAELAMRLGLLSSKKDKNTIMNYLNQIASWKEDGLDVEQVKAAEDLSNISTGPMMDDTDFLIRASKIFEAYQLELQTRRWCDFADLVLNMVRIFRAHPDVRDLEAGRFKYIMVDEFQDTSPVQNQWVAWMARDHRNICVVGDTDQSIYEWRNARPEIMMNFPKVWKGCAQVTIDMNYRSTQEILDVANAVVAPLRKKDGLDKLLESPRSGDHPSHFMRYYDSGRDEADEIAALAASKIDRGEVPAEIAILCRSGMIITGIERALRERGVRYVVAGAMKFTEREEIKDALAWLNIATNPMDYVHFSRLASKPSRGLGPQKIGDLRRVMMADNCSIRDAAAVLATRCKKGSAAYRTYNDLAETLDTIESILQNGPTAGAILDDILDETGYWDWRRENDKDPQHELRLENLDLIIDEASGYATPMEFLEMISLQAGADKGWGDDSIVVSTVHASKGLEFNCVFCPAMEEGVFPNARSEKTSYGPDEERRLAHVAWTRARSELHVSYAGYRMGTQSAGQPSRYLGEAGLLDAPSTFVDPRAPRRLRARKF
jgi:DNA helicase-2/ATP-dependent DNA helicase PcrA